LLLDLLETSLALKTCYVFLVACCVCLTRHIYRLSEFLWLVIYLAYWNSSDSSLQVFFRLLGYWALLKRASRAVPQSGGATPAGAGACGYFVRVACDTCCFTFYYIFLFYDVFCILIYSPKDRCIFPRHPTPMPPEPCNAAGKTGRGAGLDEEE